MLKGQYVVLNSKLDNLAFYRLVIVSEILWLCTIKMCIKIYRGCISYL